jgi:homoserine O-acetyltransferase
MPRTPERLHLPAFDLESGQTLRDVHVAYHLDGTIDAARANVVLVHHALTGSADAVGDWWADCIGPGRAVDTTRWAVLSTNLLGSCYGTTGPRWDDGGTFPRITIRDQARLALEVVRRLDIRRVALVCGGSLGGMVTWETVALAPDLVEQAVVFAAPARQTALGAAWGACMRRALEIGGPQDGLALARMIGMVSYRASASLEAKHAPLDSPYDTPRVAEWLDAHGTRLVARFDAAAYRTLVDAMDTHDIWRGREAQRATLSAQLAARLTVAGIPGDLLYPAEDVWRDAAAIGARLGRIDSPHGHDAFLLEDDQVAAQLAAALARTVAQRSAPPNVTSPTSSTSHETTARKRDSGIRRSSLTPASVPTIAPAVVSATTGHSVHTRSGARVM